MKIPCEIKVRFKEMRVQNGFFFMARQELNIAGRSPVITKRGPKKAIGEATKKKEKKKESWKQQLSSGKKQVRKI